jgi:hypothetical protein
LSEVGLSTASFVRLIDVVGDGSNKDTAGDPIYDPWPNDNGFNVGGVGVLSMVPEPGSLALLASGVVWLAVLRRRICVNRARVRYR